jgi:hypothetical protein
MTKTVVPLAWMIGLSAWMIGLSAWTIGALASRGRMEIS